jgi:hypothetical protein
MPRRTQAARRTVTMWRASVGPENHSSRPALLGSPLGPTLTVKYVIFLFLDSHRADGQFVDNSPTATLHCVRATSFLHLRFLTVT